MAMKKVLVAVFSGLILANPAFAEDLLAVYQQALENDPILQTAKATRDANMEVLPQSVASLLPNIAATAQTTSVHTSDPSVAVAMFTGNNNRFNQHDYALTLTQPIFNFQYWMQVRTANDAAKQAQATYNAALQDLIIRVSSAYFNVLNAEDNVEYTTAHEKAVLSQLKLIKSRYKVGLDTKTNVYQAQADYDSLVAARISAENNVENSKEALRVITAQRYPQLTPLSKTIPLVSPQPANVEEWIAAGEKNNWTLMAAHYASLAAKENIRVNYAGHFPTVNAVGSYQNGNNLGVNQTNQTQWESQVGVQVSVPLFQGGAVTSKTRQAQDQYVAASDQMEASRRQVILQTEQAFNNVMAGISKIEADRISVMSSVSALNSTQAGYKAGTKTLLDMLTAEQNVYQAKTMLAADHYSYITNTLLLKQASGSLSGADVVAVNRWLEHS